MSASAGPVRSPLRTRIPTLEPWLARVSVVALLVALATNALRPMVAYRALDLGASPAEIGLVAASFSILAVVVALPAGAWADRVGGEIVAVVGTGLMAAGSFALVFVDSLVLLGAAYTCAGLGQTVTLIGQQAIVGNTGGRKGRDSRYGVYTSAASVGQLIGPSLAGALVGAAVFGPGLGQGAGNAEAAAFLVAAACCVGSSAICLADLVRMRWAAPSPVRGATAAEEPHPVRSFLPAAGRVLRREGMLRAMVASTVTVSSIDMLGAYLPVYGEENHLAVELVGFLLSLRAGATLVSRVLLGEALRRLGRRRLLSIGLFVAAVTIAIVPVTASGDVLVILMVAFGLGVGVSQPITIGWVADSSPRRERATAIGIRVTANRLSQLVVPVAMGAVAGAAGVAMIFVALGVLLGSGAAAAATSSFAVPARSVAPEPGPPDAAA
ncbi:MAG TPA: MFS transporter [Candidatus Limnocylindrales bacterium]|nr:MFS transporter [Candidatus Limnocylindrales bacterium]